MWLFTKYGFYSAVCARQGDGGHNQSVDPELFMVRARRRAHLDALIERFPEELADHEVKKTPHTDYRYRLFVAKDAWRRIVDDLVGEMDYDNFKSKVAAHDGLGDYERSLHDVWSVMRGLQNPPDRR